MYVVSKEELKESLKALYDKHEAECRTMTHEELVKSLTLMADTQAALIARMEEDNELIDAKSN